jgi:hypothetical protein
MVADMSRALKSRAVQRSEKSSLMTEMGQSPPIPFSALSLQVRNGLKADVAGNLTN